MIKNKSYQKTIVFLHIPKAAGNTVSNIAERNFSPKSILKLYKARKDGFSLDYLQKKTPSEQQEIKLIEGHFGFGIDQLIPQQCIYLTFLRNPISRFISAYHYIYRKEDHENHQVLASNNLSLDDYVRSGLVEEKSLDNVHVRFLSGEKGNINQTQPLPLSALEVAKRNLEKHCLLPGIVEDFDKSIFLLKKLLGWENIYYAALNRKPKKNNQENNLSEETLSLIQKYNELDLELYHYGKELLDRLFIQQGREFEEQLEQFKVKNKTWVGRLSYIKATTTTRLRKEFHKKIGV